MDSPNSHFSFPDSCTPTVSGSGPYPPSNSCSNSESGSNPVHCSPNAPPREPIPSAGNHPSPPSPPPPPHGGDSSSSKIHNDKVDDTIAITSLYTPRSKLNQKESSLKDTATSPLSSWKKQEIHLLNDMLEFYNRNGTYPYDDSNSMQKFHEQWIQRRGFCKDEDVLSNKMVELHQRFLINLRKLLSEGRIEDWMDPVEIKVYWLSYKIWGHENDGGDL